MEVNNAAQAENISTTTSSKESGTKKIQSYPMKDLQFVLNFANKIYTELDHTSTNKAQAIAHVNGLKENSIKQVLSTAQQYNILELKFGIGYKLTPLFYDIIHPSSENEKNVALLKALEGPDLYKELFKLYNGLIVPQEQFIINKLIKDFGILDYVAATVAKSFIKNLNDFGLVTPSGILSVNKVRSAIVDKTDASNIGKPKDSAEDLTDADKNGQSSDANIDESVIKLEIKLKNKRFANLVFPKDYDDADLSKMHGVIVAYLNAYSDSGDITVPQKK